jgi:hypothetical protein
MTGTEKIGAWFFSCLGIVMVAFGILVVPANALADAGSDCTYSCGVNYTPGTTDYYKCLGGCCNDACYGDPTCASNCCNSACGSDPSCSATCYNTFNCATLNPACAVFKTQITCEPEFDFQKCTDNTTCECEFFGPPANRKCICEPAISSQ